MKKDFASLKPEEALHVAIFIEERNARMYEEFGQVFAPGRDKDSQEIAATFREMANEERHHATVLMSRYLERYNMTPCVITDQDVQELIELPQPNEEEYTLDHLRAGKASRQKVLEIALAAETRARDFYLKLLKSEEDPEMRALYTEMAQFENEHEQFLRRRVALAKYASDQGNQQGGQQGGGGLAGA